MEKDITESEFKNKGPELFRKLEEDAKALEVDQAAYDESIKLINEGKTLFTQGDIPGSLGKYKEAGNKIAQVISTKSEPLAWKLFWIELGYLFILLFLGYLTYKWPDYGLWKDLINQSLQTAWFGALGGTTIAIYGIYSHVQLKDFDPKFQLWYLCKPIIGGIFGWFVYLIFFLGFVSISIQGKPMDLDKMPRPQMAFLIAFLAGFSERFTIKMIDKLMSVLITWEDKKSDSK
ncbi:MAG: hypothetical protein ABSE95_12435 [Thermodesulfobacteriota bacterium]|jgi:tetratricopeptide (TPR) repeat protein